MTHRVKYCWAYLDLEQEFGNSKVQGAGKVEGDISLMPIRVEALRYTRVRFPMGLLKFFFDLILPFALWAWGLLGL